MRLPPRVHAVRLQDYGVPSAESRASLPVWRSAAGGLRALVHPKLLRCRLHAFVSDGNILASCLFVALAVLFAAVTHRLQALVGSAVAGFEPDPYYVLERWVSMVAEQQQCVSAFVFQGAALCFGGRERGEQDMRVGRCGANVRQLEGQQRSYGRRRVAVHASMSRYAASKRAPSYESRSGS